MPTWFEKMLNSQYAMVGLAVLAFLVALWLVITIVRTLAGGRLKMPGNRTRQPRLGIVDAYDLDRQRQLIIVRRDNTEHLIMIGGPNDLVIESEIVRMESRDNRREKAGEFVGSAAAASDVRIPAPFSLSDRPDPGLGEAGLRAEEPILPMSSPAAGPHQASTLPAPPPVESPFAEQPAPPVPPRAPTFPLPPRRPAPLPERRTQPSPPRIPDGATRGDLAPAIGATPQAEPFPASLAPAGGAAPLPSDVGARGAARPPQPPFLKPLPPRPPLRPLQRATPHAPAPSDASPIVPPADPTVPPPSKPATGPAPSLEQSVQDGGGATPAISPQPSEAPLIPQPPAPQTVAPPPGETRGEKDALESLEEEMAKLLGRG